MSSATSAFKNNERLTSFIKCALVAGPLFCLLDCGVLEEGPHIYCFLLGYSFKPRPNINGRVGSVVTISISINGCLHSSLPSPEIWALVTSKA